MPKPRGLTEYLRDDLNDALAGRGINVRPVATRKLAFMRAPSADCVFAFELPQYHRAPGDGWRTVTSTEEAVQRILDALKRAGPVREIQISRREACEHRAAGDDLWTFTQIVALAGGTPAPPKA